MARQARQAVLEADAVVFVVDGRHGLTSHDALIAAELRRSARAAARCQQDRGHAARRVVAEFHALGLGDPIPISSAHGEGVRSLVEEALAPSFAAGAFARRSVRSAAPRGTTPVEALPNARATERAAPRSGEERARRDEASRAKREQNAAPAPPRA